MLLVRASARSSSIQGMGLFADERIPKDTVIWKFHSKFDVVFDSPEVEKLPPLQQAFLETYAYFSKDMGKYVCSLDDSRFMNHSSVNDNVIDVLLPGETESVSMAKRDIEVGEELLINYRTFDGNDEVSDEEYLKT